jgi:hypothetical protein
VPGKTVAADTLRSPLYVMTAFLQHAFSGFLEAGHMPPPALSELPGQFQEKRKRNQV